MDLKFSLFHSAKGLENITPLKEIDLPTLDRVLNSDKLKHLSIKLNKLELPYITAYGTFKIRNNDSIKHYNNSLIALDFDGLNVNSAKDVFAIISSNPSTVFCFISPSRKGVKAMIYNKHNIEPKDLYSTLKHNSIDICSYLGLDVVPDLAQFKLSQPLFLFNDGENMHVNLNPTNLGLQLKEPKKYKFEPLPIRKLEIKEKQKTRIDKYLINSLQYVTKDLANQREGNRHSSIVKVKGIRSLLHYAPHLESEFKSHLLCSVVAMYGSEKEALKNNAYKSFESAWNSAEMKANSSIEQIISEA